MGHALSFMTGEDARIHIVTNEKKKDTALRLAKMAQTGVLNAELSLDEFHERPDPRVQTAFT